MMGYSYNGNNCIMQLFGRLFSGVTLSSLVKFLSVQLISLYLQYSTYKL